MTVLLICLLLYAVVVTVLLCIATLGSPLALMARLVCCGCGALSALCSKLRPSARVGDERLSVPLSSSTG